MKTFFLTLCLFISVTWNGWTIERQEMKQGASITSTDGQFTVTYGYRIQDKDTVLSILNNRTGLLYASIPSLPCYLLKWAPDSKTLVAVFAIAGGNSVSVFHFDGAAWQHVADDSQETEDFLDSEVIKIELGSEIKLTIVASDRPSNELNITYYYLIKFDIDPATRLISNKSKTQIDKQKYAKLIEQAQLK